jgi:hypothetical protein
LLETALQRVLSELEPAQGRAVLVEMARTVENAPDCGRDKNVKAFFEPVTAAQWNSIVLRVSDFLIARAQGGEAK